MTLIRLKLTYTTLKIIIKGFLHRMSVNKFKQIANTIEARIASGTYKINSKLPPHRNLASEFSTTPATISKAYKVLIEKNKIESFIGRGTFVCGNSKLETVIKAPTDNNDYNFTILQPCLIKNTLQLQNAFNIAFSDIAEEFLGYIENSGHSSHKDAGMKWAQNFGLDCADPEDFLLVNGAQNALDILIRTYTKPDDVIAVEELTYPGILSITSLLGRKIVEVKIDNFGMCSDDLEEVIKNHQPKMIIVIPSHQNPTGFTMDKKRRLNIAKVIQNSNAWLVEDDVYGFLNAETIPAICNSIPEQSFHITSLSKAISPALRCAYIKSPKNEARKIGACIRSSIWLASPFNFAVAAQLINSGVAFEIAQSQKELAIKRQNFVRKKFSHLQYSCQESSYHIWLTLPDNWQQEQFVMEANNLKLLVSSGRYFTQRINETNHIRLSLMAISDEKRFEEGIISLANLLKDEPRATFPF